MESFNEEFHPRGKADHWTLLQCSNCMQLLDKKMHAITCNDDISKKNLFVCETVGCSYVACPKCKNRLFNCSKTNNNNSNCSICPITPICPICSHGKKLLTTKTYDENEKSENMNKVISNTVLSVMINMISDIYEAENDTHALVIDGSQLITTSCLLQADNIIHVTAINGNKNEINRIARNYENHQDKNRITLVHTKFSEHCTKMLYECLKSNKTNIGLYNLIYIDGCGSWGGNQQVNIREDIHRAISLLHPGKCAFAITFSQRDSASDKAGDNSNNYQLYVIWLLSRLGRTCRVILDRDYGCAMVFMVFAIDALNAEDRRNNVVLKKFWEFENFKNELRLQPNQTKTKRKFVDVYENSIENMIENNENIENTLIITSEKKMTKHKIEEGHN